MQDTLAPVSISAPQAEEFFPLALARDYAFPLQHRVIGSQPFFAVQDWIGGLTHCKSPSRLWSQIKRRAAAKGFAFSGRILKLPYCAANGRVYQMDFAELKPLYEIVLKLRANTPALNAVWRYLWDAGVMLNSADPSASENWIAWMHHTRSRDLYTRCAAMLGATVSIYMLISEFFSVRRALYWFTYMPNQSDSSKKVARALVEDFYTGIAELIDAEPLFLPVSRWMSIVERAIDLMSD
jgi:hypothetical protein